MFHYPDHPFTVMHDKYGHFTIIILMHDRYSDDPFTDLHDKCPDHLQFSIPGSMSRSFVGCYLLCHNEYHSGYFDNPQLGIAYGW